MAPATPTRCSTWCVARSAAGSTGSTGAGPCSSRWWSRSRARRLYIAVVGPGESASEDDVAAARAVGDLLARAGCVVLTGGLGGVMAGATDGAHQAGGLTVALLPGTTRADCAATVALPTGLGELRNGLLVRAADAVIAVGCSWGTLSEIALARRTGVPLVLLDPWDLPEDVGVVAPDAAAAVDAVVELLSRMTDG